MDTPSPPQNIIIVGAGIAGIACAIALSQELTPYVPNLKITIYERHDILSTSGGAINLTPVAQRHLDQLGVLHELDQLGSDGGAEVDAIEMYSIRSGRGIGTIDFTDQKGGGFGGYKGRRVMRIMLSMALVAVVEKSPNIRIKFGHKVVGGEEVEGFATVHFENGSRAVGDLVIGCDGVHSALRTRWIDPHSPSEYTGLSFLQANIPVDTISSRIHFKAAALNISRHGSLLTSFCDGNHEEIFAAAIVQFSQSDLNLYRPELGQDWATQHRIQCVLRDEIRARFSKTTIPCIREMVNSEAKWLLYPVYQVPPGGRWCMNRAILLGDAAHAMPPRDESAAYALDDAILFSRILAHHRSEPLTEVFEAYEGIRREKINTAFKESCKMWERNRDMGHVEARIKEWVMPFYLRSHRDERQAAWEFDAAKIPIPALTPSEDSLSLSSYLREASKEFE